MARKGDRTRPGSTDIRGAQLIGVIVLSLGLWVAIWDAFASLFSAVFR
jgi:hypothetical protein